MIPALRRRRAGLLADTMTMTNAQASAVELELAVHPVAKANPAIAAAVAAACGWPVAERQLSPGERLLNLTKG